MSEYQYYGFAAVDRPLGARELDALRGLSTRAHITATSFVNTYQWGRFKVIPAVGGAILRCVPVSGEPGTLELIVRLPARLVDPEIVQRYCSGDAVSAWDTGDQVIVAAVSAGAGVAVRGERRSLFRRAG